VTEFALPEFAYIFVWKMS